MRKSTIWLVPLFCLGLIPLIYAADETSEQPTELLLFKSVPNVVSASLISQKTTEAAAAITVITAEEIKAKGYRSIKDVLVDVPGFVDLSDANENIVGVRGVFASTTNTILILINGHRMNDFNLGRWNTDFYLGLDTVKRIEIIKGPASVLYGTGALSGVINIITKSGKDVDGTYVSAKGVEWKDNTYDFETTMTWGKKVEDLDVLFNYTYKEAQGDVIPQPAAVDKPRTGAGQPGDYYYNKYPDNWSAFASMENKDMSLNIRHDAFSRFVPRAGNSSFMDYDVEPIKHDFGWTDTTIDYKYNFHIDDKSKIVFNPGFNAYSLEEFSSTGTYDANWIPPYGTVSGQVSQYNTYQLNAHYENQILDNLNLIAGEDYFRNDFYDMNGITSTNGSPWALNPGQDGIWTLFGVYLQAIWTPISKLQITASGRYDDFTCMAPPNISPRAGIVYQYTDTLSNKLLYGESYLSPEWAHERIITAGGLYNPDPNIKPELFKGLDYILEFNNADTHLSLDLFAEDVDGLISANGIYSYTNFGDEHYKGLEFEGKYNILQQLQANASYSLVADRGNTIPNSIIESSIKDIPQNVYRLGLTYSPIKNLSILAWGRTYSSVRTTDNVLPGQTYLASWTTLDMSVNYKWEDLDLQAGVTNLGDANYEVTGTVNRPAPRPGRAFNVAIGYKF